MRGRKERTVVADVEVGAAILPPNGDAPEPVVVRTQAKGKERGIGTISGKFVVYPASFTWVWLVVNACERI